MDLQKDPSKTSRRTRDEKARALNDNWYTRRSRSADLCDGFLSMLSCLDHSNPAHREILDGALYILIKTVGRRLSWAMWQQDACSQGDYDAFGLEGETKEQKEAAFEAQAPFLIWLFERVLKLAANSESYSTNEAIAVDCSSALRKIPCGVSDSACLKLQNTLVNAVFGMDSEEACQPSLSPPEVPRGLETDLQTFSSCKDITAADHFKDEVWRLLGWDVLIGIHQRPSS